jgi:hypothetical protein
LIEKQEPDAAKVLAGLQLVHVNVIGMDDQTGTNSRSAPRRFARTWKGKGGKRSSWPKRTGRT